MNKQFKKLLKVIYKPKHETKWWMWWNLYSGARGALLLATFTILPAFLLGITRILPISVTVVLLLFLSGYPHLVERLIKKLY